MSGNARWHVTDTQTQTSLTLLGRVAAKDDELACTTFVEHYAPLVRSLARRAGFSHDECEDLVQEVMFAAIDALRRQRYDRALGRFKAWFKGVIYHKIVDARRSTASPAAPDGRSDPATAAFTALRSRGHLSDIPDPAPGPDEQFEAAFEAEWQKAAFDDALDQVRFEVEPVTFQAFDLYVRKERPPREVAKLLGISRNTVYLAKSRILARIRDKLADTPPS
jgi:RNA polymerase sigma factor (sigma-70 family)